MEKSEISRLISSFNAIKDFFDTTKQYMPQIAKLVFFIEEIIPLLETIHLDLHQTTTLMPSATEKLGKVTAATEIAATEVMNIVDNVIIRLTNMSDSLEQLESKSEEGIDAAFLKEKTSEVKNEIDKSQNDLFSIMNALQFQDITTQQINSIISTIDVVNGKISDLLKGFDDDGKVIGSIKREVAFDSNAEFDFDRSAKSQRVADDYLKMKKKDVIVDAGNTSGSDVSPDADKEMTEESSELYDKEIIFDEDGQPDISSIKNQLNSQDKK